LQLGDLVEVSGKLCVVTSSPERDFFYDNHGKPTIVAWWAKMEYLEAPGCGPCLTQEQAELIRLVRGRGPSLN
jgi:hypothetical protein